MTLDHFLELIFGDVLIYLRKIFDFVLGSVRGE